MGRSETTEHLGTFRHQELKETNSILSQLRTRKELYQAGPQFSTNRLHPPRNRLLSRLCAPPDGEMKRVEKRTRSISSSTDPSGQQNGSSPIHGNMSSTALTVLSSVTKGEHSRVSAAKKLRKWSIKLFEIQPLRNTRTSDTNSAVCRLEVCLLASQKGEYIYYIIYNRWPWPSLGKRSLVSAFWGLFPQAQY